MSNYQEEYFRKRNLQKSSGVTDLSGPTPKSAYANMSREAMDKSLKERNLNPSATPAPAAPTSGLAEAGQSMGTQMASSSAQQGDLMGTVGGAAMMSGNPYLMAGGLGLQVLAAGEKNKRAAEEQQRLAYNDRIAQRQQILQQIASQGIQ